MKKNYLILATAALVFAGCASDEYLDDEKSTQVENAEKIISFNSEYGATTRASKSGADAATALGKEFVVEGTKYTVNPSTMQQVFNDYTVKWNNGAATTTTNSSGWEYVDQGGTGKTQTIKYWDYGAQQYHFAAYSLGNVASKAIASEIDLTVAENKISSAYTLMGTADQLAACYITDLKTVIPEGTGAAAHYPSPVQFTFRSLGAKVRVAFYETIPGYAVNDLKFYSVDGTKIEDDDETTEVDESEVATLYNNDATPVNIVNSKGTITVKYNTVDDISYPVSADNNKAHVSFEAAAEGNTASPVLSLAVLNYTKEITATGVASAKYLGDNVAEATYATDKAYTSVLPNESGASLTLKVDYTLTSIDGSKETIKVTGATATVPANYAKWLPNHAYTYIFKISDNTNGATNPDLGPAGLFPITFDAVVADDEADEQQTITTVATPSITTYQNGQKVSGNNEYAAGDVYAQVMNNSSLVTSLTTTNTFIYSMSKAATEAEVTAALQLSENGVTGKTVGRNGLELTSGTVTCTITEIPGIGTVNSGEAAKFTVANSTPNPAYYAFVYQSATSAATPAYEYLPVTVSTEDQTSWATVYTKYYTANTGAGDPYVVATTTYSGATQYYKKYDKNANTYAVKVIKVKATATP